MSQSTSSAAVEATDTNVKKEEEVSQPAASTEINSSQKSVDYAGPPSKPLSQSEASVTETTESVPQEESNPVAEDPPAAIDEQREEPRSQGGEGDVAKAVLTKLSENASQEPQVAVVNPQKRLSDDLSPPDLSPPKKSKGLGDSNEQPNSEIPA